MVILQIESPRALEQVEAIARVPGVDVLMFGPGDFSVLSGVPYQFGHALLVAARERVAKAAKTAGIHWGTVSPTPEVTAKLMEMGARFICHGADIILVKRGLEQMQAQFAPLGFTFENQLAAMSAELEHYK